MSVNHTTYILDENNHTIAVDLITWTRWFENETNRRVAYTEINSKISVSTVFLGTDHRFGKGPPLLFETMIFGGERDGEMFRYSSWEDAEIGHAATVRKLRNAT